MQPEEPVRRPSWATFVYYYLAALIGAIVIITGAVRVADGVVIAAFPTDSPSFEGFQGFDPTMSGFGVKDREEGLRRILGGLLVMGIGLPVFLWHLNEARKREGDPPVRLGSSR